MASLANIKWDMPLSDASTFIQEALPVPGNSYRSRTLANICTYIVWVLPRWVLLCSIPNVNSACVGLITPIQRKFCQWTDSPTEPRMTELLKTKHQTTESWTTQHRKTQPWKTRPRMRPSKNMNQHQKTQPWATEPQIRPHHWKDWTSNLTVERLNMETF